MPMSTEFYIAQEKGFLCEIHGARHGDLCFKEGDYDGEWKAFCGLCMLNKFLEIGLKPMKENKGDT